MGPEQNWAWMGAREMTESQPSSGNGGIWPPPASSWSRVTQASM